jgi:hypothetical protein
MMAAVANYEPSSSEDGDEPNSETPTEDQENEKDNSTTGDGERRPMKRVKREVKSESADGDDALAAVGQQGAGAEKAVLKVFVESLATIVAHNVMEGRQRFENGDLLDPRIRGMYANFAASSSNGNSSGSSSSMVANNGSNSARSHASSEGEVNPPRSTTELFNRMASGMSTNIVRFVFQFLSSIISLLGNAVSLANASSLGLLPSANELDDFKTNICSQDSVGTFALGVSP